MSETTRYQCTVCGKVIQSNGWVGHAGSKEHRENGGTDDTYIVVDADDDAAAVVADVLPDASEEEIRQILSENAELREKILSLEKDKIRLNPLADWPVWESADQVREWLGDAHVQIIGEVELAAENKRRQKSGLPPLYSDNPAEYDRLVARAIDKAVKGMVEEQSRWTGGVADGKHLRMRTFKMVFPKRGCDCGEKVCYRHGSMRQIPIELQINNGAASLNDPVERYKRKGAKPAAPIRCKLVDCYRAASISPATGEWANSMYCSQLHHDYVEGATATSNAGNRMTVYEPTLG